MNKNCIYNNQTKIPVLQEKYETLLAMAVSGDLKIEQNPDDELNPLIVSIRSGARKVLTIVKLATGAAKQPRMFVRLAMKGKIGKRQKRINISYPRLVWIIDRKAIPPIGYEANHWPDENFNNNLADNIVMLHPLDHLIFHRKKNLKVIPF